MKTQLEAYTHHIRKLFGFLKNTTVYSDLLSVRLELNTHAGFLMPLCRLHLKDRRLISQLSAWREENSFAFPTRFTVTDKGTKRWIEKGVLDVEDRILFLVCNELGEPVGHVGFANCVNEDAAMEIDNVVRGDSQAPKGIMSEAMSTLLNWAGDNFKPSRIYLRVFSDNDKAIRFYRALNFTDDREIPLRQVEEGDMTRFVETEEKPDASFLRMVYHAPALTDPESVILTAGPLVSAYENVYVADAARHGWNTQWSKYLSRFQSEFAEYVGAKYALSTSSCTGALHLALLGCDIGPGDEVIVPEITWVATANAVSYCGATPVFADVEIDSWCMDPASVESLMTPKTKAIMPVHLYGHPARMDGLMSLAREHGLRVIEDAAPAIGSEFQGQQVGTFGDVGAYSFQGAKLAVTGEGGMLVTNNETLFRKIHKIWDQGRKPGTFWIEETGWKYKMSNLQAAFGLGQLEQIEALIASKRKIFSWYRESLEGLGCVSLNKEVDGARSIYWMSSIRLLDSCPVGRDDMISRLGAEKIDTRPVFSPISRYPIWNRTIAAGKNAALIGDNAINLPSGVCLQRPEVDYICECIKEIVHTG